MDNESCSAGICFAKRQVAMAGRAILIVLTMTLLGAITVHRAHAASIVVNSLANTAANDGVCTLREAIESANLNTASGAMSGECAAGDAPTTIDVITFSVTGTIVTSAGGGVLPGIGAAGGDDAGYVTIDGDTNNDGIPDITLDRNGSGNDGFHIGRGSVAAVNVTITGIEIREYGGQGIEVERAEDLVIEDCYIHDGGNQGIRISHNDTDRVTIRRLRVGLDGSGAASGNDGNGIQINDGADRVTIEDCVISANGVNNTAGDGIQIAGGGASATGHIIRDNFIGTDLTGTTCGASGGNPPWNTFGNALIGIDVTGNPSNVTIEDNVIGCSGRMQTVGGQQGDGIEVTGGVNLFLFDGNYIGTNSTGADLGNAQYGIQLDGGDNSTIIGNTIAFNGFISTSSHQDGIGITGPSSDGHSITQNSIYGNDGIGIKLSQGGNGTNDVGDTDGGSNALQNFPVISSAANNGMGGYDVNYSWDFRTTLEGPWTIEFFCNSDGGTQGRSYQASVTILAGTPSGTQTSTFTPVPGTCNTSANVITATATNSDSAGGSTSEFSATFNPTAIQVTGFRAHADGNLGQKLALVALSLAAVAVAVGLRRRGAG